MKTLFTLFTAVLLTATAFGQGEQLYADGTATDQSGNTFEWINYGAHDWAIENAEVETYRDGTPIPQVTDEVEWQSLTTGAWCYINNDPTKRKLYNWYAVAGIHDNDESTPNKEFAPVGWRVSNESDWLDLKDYLIYNGYNFDSTSEGNKIAKSMASIAQWNQSLNEGAVGNNPNINNYSGFNAIPDGFRELESTFKDYGVGANFWVWMVNEGNTNPYYWLASYDNYLQTTFTNVKEGLSVRFVRDASSVGANGDILLNGTVSAENNQIKNVADPTEAQDVTTKSYVDNSVSNTYTQAEVDALLANLQSQIDDLDSDNSSGSATDQDGNTYDYLPYGDQVWTVENAQMVTYRDGTPIPEVTDPTQWSNLTTGAWCYYDNDPTKPRLYNWYAVAGIHDTDPNTPNKELAPAGWHVPTDAEWTMLEEYLIANGYNYDGTTTENKIAKAMASSTGWNSSTDLGAPGNNQSLNNNSGFNAFPVGYRNIVGSFRDEGSYAIFWSSTVYNANNAWYRYLNYNYSYLFRYYDFKHYGFSVRFVRD